MSGLELLSRHRVGGSVILVIQQPSAHQPERLSSEWRRLRIWKSKKQRRTTATIGELSWRQSMDLMTLHPNHANKYGDSGFQMF
jgi:hypothetical protein